MSINEAQITAYEDLPDERLCALAREGEGFGRKEPRCQLLSNGSFSLLAWISKSIFSFMKIFPVARALISA